MITMRVELTVLAIMAVALAPAPALPHGGEVHGDEEQPSTPLPIGGGIHMAIESQFLVGVLTEVVQERDLRHRLRAFGTVTARSDRHAEIFAPQAGRVLDAMDGRLPYVGERVVEGQTLVVIEASLSTTDRADLGSQRIQAESQVAQARARMQQAERDVERLRELRGVVADREIQAAELTFEVAGREYRRARRELSLLTTTDNDDSQLTRFPIVAPIDGVVSEVHLTLGEQIDESHLLFSIFDPATLWVEASVYESDLGRVGSNAEARITVDAYQDISFEGTLFSFSPTVDQTTRTISAVFEVDNPEGLLRPGMFAEVEISAGEASPVLAVPDAAIVTREGRRLVYVHTDPELFEAREVLFGFRDGNYWSVRNGLSAGDRVVIQGVHQVRSAGQR
jgi:cobalt-zinc-cadmium efflux system membrane fusion protein